MAAYKQCFGAETPDLYKFENGIATPTRRCLLRGCLNHAIRDATHKSKAGYGHLVAHAAKDGAET